MKYPSIEFDEAVAAACHGTIAPENLERLHELLANDAAAQDEYLWRVELHGALVSASLDPSRVLPVSEEEVGPASRLGQRPEWRQSALSLSVLAVALVAVLLAVARLRPDSPEGVVAEEMVAEVVSLTAADWMRPESLAVGQQLAARQRLELAEGVAEVLFTSGARLQMYGPAIVEPTSGNSAVLLLGQVEVTAETPQSKGFVLVTQTTAFIDIGTRFTATVAPDGRSQLTVVDGEVHAVLADRAEPSRVRAGETLCVEPGDSQVVTRIERGDETAAFVFPTIRPPSGDDAADRLQGRAVFTMVGGRLNSKSGPLELLGDGVAQSVPDSPRESVFIANSSQGRLLLDLGGREPIGAIHTYSWHQNRRVIEHRERAVQRYTVYGWPEHGPPVTEGNLMRAGWKQIARVNTDEFFQITERIERPAQQGVAITSAKGEIGRYRYLLFDIRSSTFFGEIDVYRVP
jgi:hypothetical protein